MSESSEQPEAEPDRRIQLQTCHPRQVTKVEFQKFMIDLQKVGDSEELPRLMNTLKEIRNGRPEFQNVIFPRYPAKVAPLALRYLWIGTAADKLFEHVTAIDWPFEVVRANGDPLNDSGASSQEGSERWYDDAEEDQQHNTSQFVNQSPQQIRGFERPRLPDDNQPTTQGFERPRLPHDNQPATRGFERPRLPNDNESATQGFERPRLPHDNQPATRGFERPRLPNDNESATQGFERPRLPHDHQASVTRGFEQPRLPNDNRQHQHLRFQPRASMTLNSSLVHMAQERSRHDSEAQRQPTMGTYDRQGAYDHDQQQPHQNNAGLLAQAHPREYDGVGQHHQRQPLSYQRQPLPAQRQPTRQSQQAGGQQTAGEFGDINQQQGIHARDQVMSMMERINRRADENMLLSGRFKRFGGDAHRVNFQRWLQGVMTRLEVNEVSEDIKLQHLMYCLEGSAEREFERDMSDACFEEAIVYLVNKYSGPGDQERRLVEFEERKQFPGESVAAFAAAIKGACPLESDHWMYNKTLINKLRTGLLNPELKRQAAMAFRRKDARFELLVEELSIIELTDREIPGRRNQGMASGGHHTAAPLSVPHHRPMRARPDFDNTQWCIKCNKHTNHVASRCPYNPGATNPMTVFRQPPNNRGQMRPGYGSGTYNNGPQASQGYNTSQNRAQLASNNYSRNYNNNATNSRAYGYNNNSNREANNQGVGPQCYVCSEYGHRAAQCPNRVAPTVHGSRINAVRAGEGDDRVLGRVEAIMTTMMQRDKERERAFTDSINKLQSQVKTLEDDRHVVGMIRVPTKVNKEEFNAKSTRLNVKPKLSVNGQDIMNGRYLLDTGAVVNLMSLELAQRLKLRMNVCKQKLTAVNNTELECHGMVTVDLRFNDKKAKISCHVVGALDREMDVLLGCEGLSAIGIQLVGADGCDYLPMCAYNGRISLVARVTKKMSCESDDTDAVFVFRGRQGQNVAGRVPLVADTPVPEEELDPDDPEQEFDSFWHVTSAEEQQPRDQGEEKRQFLEEISIEDQLSEEDKIRLSEVLWDNKVAFSSKLAMGTTQDVTDLGSVQVRHHIHTGDHPPFKLKERRMPFSVRMEVRKMIDDLLEAGVIRPSTSPYSSCVVLVRKRDGSWRMCVDYRRLNSQTTRDAYPLPRVDDIIDSLAGASIFSSCDVKMGYHNVPMAEDSIEKTAFCVLGRLYEYLYMPFGLTSAPATFMRLMNNVLKDFIGKCVVIYMDDILIFSRSVDEHIEQVDAVLKALRVAGLKLNPAKCKFAAGEVRFLGHKISAAGIEIDPEKAAAIAKFPQPGTKTEMQSFLGLVNYVRRHYKNFAMRVAPIQALVKHSDKGSAKLAWTEETIEVFHKLRRELSTPPLLSMPVVGRPYMITTDASMVGLGGMLEQEQESGNKLIAFASKPTTKAERKYCPTDLELRAVVFALDKFRTYVLGEQITVITDHQPLVALLKKELPSVRLYRWALVIQQYDAKVIYRPGVSNTVADALSRAPVIGRITMSAVQQTEVIARHHEGMFGGHAGANKVIARLKALGYAEGWSTLKQDVEKFVSRCNVCRQRSTRYERLPLLHRPPPQQPRQEWHADYMEVRKGSRKPFALTMIDAFSRWILLLPAGSQDGATTIRGLKMLMQRFGVPKKLVTDQGRHFVCRNVAEFLAGCSVEHETTTANAKNANALVERANRSVQDVIAKVMAQEDRNLNTWHEWAAQAVACYNATPHTSLGMKSPLQVMHAVPFSTTSEEFVEESVLEDYWQGIRNDIMQQQRTYAANRTSDRAESRYREGDTVFVRDPTAMNQRKAKIDLPNSHKGVVISIDRRHADVMIGQGQDERMKRVPLTWLQPRFEGDGGEEEGGATSE